MLHQVNFPRPLAKHARSSPRKRNVPNQRQTHLQKSIQSNPSVAKAYYYTAQRPITSNKTAVQANEYRVNKLISHAIRPLRVTRRLSNPTAHRQKAT